MLRDARFSKPVYIKDARRVDYVCVDPGTPERPNPFQDWKLIALPHALRIELPSGIYGLVPYSMVESMSGRDEPSKGKK